jgi:integrase
VTEQLHRAVPDREAWPWPVDLAGYDRTPVLAAEEREALTALGVLREWRAGHGDEWAIIERLVRPLADARVALDIGNPRQARIADRAVSELLFDTLARGEAYWAWSAETWISVLGRDQRSFFAAHPRWDRGDLRQHMIAIAYLLCCFNDLPTLGRFERETLALKVFGRPHVTAAVTTITEVLAGWGYADHGAGHGIRRVLCEALLESRSPLLGDVTVEVLDKLRQRFGAGSRANLHQVHRALAALGLIPGPVPPEAPPATLIGGDPAWSEWVLRWEATSTLTPSTRRHARSTLLKVGRWLTAEHPHIREPGQLTRETCAAAVAAVDRMRVGDHVARRDGLNGRLGKPLAARSKDDYLGMLRQFFRDCAEWGWIPRRFDPGRALTTPRSVKALIGPEPRLIADDRWAKLLWAGLNLEQQDLPAGKQYPLELVRALALAWLFSGLRGNEIVRLRLGCVRWQSQPGQAGEDAVCLLDVPAHKTGTCFTKPVDPLLGRTLIAWEAARPAQPHLVDRRTGERVALLFSYRAKRVATQHLNAGIIPALCRKAGIPTSDARGRITSHRARSTIASHLYNAKDPMSLFELQAWLGHRSPQTTQSYAAITPTTLARAYSDAGYFARNLRTIEVLIDRDAVASGAAASGSPWQFFDLGHGLCTYSFFEQCPHRMACARCDFYVPKASSKGQLLEARDNLQRMLIEIPLTEGERAARRGRPGRSRPPPCRPHRRAHAGGPHSSGAGASIAPRGPARPRGA